MPRNHDGRPDWNGHPHEIEVRGQLVKLRVALSALRERGSSFNANHAPPDENTGVIVHVGQNVTDEDEGVSL